MAAGLRPGHHDHQHQHNHHSHGKTELHGANARDGNQTHNGVKLHSEKLLEPDLGISGSHVVEHLRPTPKAPPPPPVAEAGKQISTMMRRVLYHEVREIIVRQDAASREASFRREANDDKPHESPQPAPAQTASRGKMILQAVRKGIRQIRMKQAIVATWQDSVERTKSASKEANSFLSKSDQQPETEKPATPPPAEEAPEQPAEVTPEEEEPALQELGTNVNAMIETFSQLQNLESRFKNPELQKSFSQVLANAERCTKLLCWLQSQTGDLVADINTLDAERENASKAMLDIVQKINADIEQLESTLHKEVEEDDDGEGTGRRRRGNFMSTASHCLYALGILKEQAAAPQPKRRFAIPASAVRDPDQLIAGTNFDAAWEAAKKNKECNFRARRKAVDHSKGANGDEDDDEEENSQLPSDWLNSVLGHLNEPAADATQGAATPSINVNADFLRLLQKRNQAAPKPQQEVPALKVVEQQEDDVEERKVEHDPSATPSTEAPLSTLGVTSVTSDWSRQTTEETSFPKQLIQKEVTQVGGASPSRPARQTSTGKGSVSLKLPAIRGAADPPEESRDVVIVQAPPEPRRYSSEGSPGLGTRSLGVPSGREGRYLARNYDSRRKTCGPMVLSVDDDDDEDATLGSSSNMRVEFQDHSDLMICSARERRRSDSHTVSGTKSMKLERQRTKPDVADGSRSQGLALTDARRAPQRRKTVHLLVDGSGCTVADEEETRSSTKFAESQARRRSWQSSDPQASNGLSPVSPSSPAPSSPSPRRTRPATDLASLVGRKVGQDPDQRSSTKPDRTRTKSAGFCSDVLEHEGL
mmetsp:Transcript_59754/g.142175  ORF Transcript_59754/g.142175 Transcript_59754/m.142175 type:complete len:819 (-) Transcript_59754:160-2616(-)